MQQDFILREIAKIGAMLRAIIKKMVELKDKESEIQNIDALKDELYNETGIDLNKLINCKPEELKEIIDKTNGLNLINLELLADLISHFSRNTDGHENKSFKLKNRAIEIYKLIDKESGTYSIERAQKIQSLSR